MDVESVKKKTPQELALARDIKCSGAECTCKESTRDLKWLEWEIPIARFCHLGTAFVVTNQGRILSLHGNDVFGVYQHPLSTAGIEKVKTWNFQTIDHQSLTRLIMLLAEEN